MRLQSLHDFHLFFPDIDGFWDPLNLSETESRIRMALPNGKATEPEHIAAVTQAVRLFSLQNKMPQAKEYLNYAELFLKDLELEDRDKFQVRYFLEEGRFFNLSMNPVRALESFRKAWVMSQEIKKLEHFAIDAAFMISITLPVKQGKEWFKMALEIAEASEEDSLASKWRSYLYLEAGWKSFDSRDFEMALNFLKKAAAINPGDSFFTRTLMWSIARCMRATGDLDGALAIQNKLLFDLLEKAEPTGFVYLEIAECYHAKQDYSKAAPNFERAHERLRENKWYSENYTNELKEILKKSKKLN